MSLTTVTTVFMIENKINYFNPIRDKNDYFPDKLTSVYCGKETKEPDTDIKPVGTSENKNDTNLQESKESAANVTETSEKEYFTGCSLDGVIEYLNSKGLSVTIDKDNNIFCVPKGGDSLIREVRVWAYTKLLEINTKVGVHVEKDIDQTVAFSEFLNNCLLSVRQHATNKVFSLWRKTVIVGSNRTHKHSTYSRTEKKRRLKTSLKHITLSETKRIKVILTLMSLTIRTI